MSKAPRSEWTSLTWQQGVRYGAMSAALAFLALPLYVLVPNHYAREFGLSLSVLGFVLLAARLLDAFLDPFFGRIIDRLFARSAWLVLMFSFLVCAGAAIGLIAILFPSAKGNALFFWLALSMAMTQSAYSFVSIAHQSWGARLGGDAGFRASVAAWRESPGLLGVILACALPIVFGLNALLIGFILLLVAGLIAWTQAPRPVFVSQLKQTPAHLLLGRHVFWLPWKNVRFRALVAVFVLNGVASSVPASLVLFFVQDRLQAPKIYEAGYLVSYFLAAACAIPLWLHLLGRMGLGKTWLSSMLLSAIVFIAAATLSAGDWAAFSIICILSGLAFGADLAFPTALLTGVIQTQGDQGQHEGAYYGWWNFAAKLNTALAAGLALPVLDFFGYQPGAQSSQALQALDLAYCVLPCVLKLIAAGALFIYIKRYPQE